MGNWINYGISVYFGVGDQGFIEASFVMTPIGTLLESSAPNSLGFGRAGYDAIINEIIHGNNKEAHHQQSEKEIQTASLVQREAYEKQLEEAERIKDNVQDYVTHQR